MNIMKTFPVRWGAVVLVQCCPLVLIYGWAGERSLCYLSVCRSSGDLPVPKVQLRLLSIGWRVYGSFVHKEVGDVVSTKHVKTRLGFYFPFLKSEVNTCALSFVWWRWKRRGGQWEPNPVMRLGGDQFGPSELRWYYWEAPVWESPAWHCDLSRMNSGVQIPL